MKNVLLALSLLAAAGASAQSAKRADVVVNQVNDRRTGGSFSELSIVMELPKVTAKQVAASRVLVTSATDDTGASLIDPQKEEPKLESSGSSRFDDKDKPSPATVTLTLKNPSRKATKVKEIRGEIELFMPASDPNSVAEVPKFMSFNGRTLNHKALKTNGVEIALLSKAQIDAERKKIADAKRKEYKDAGYEDGEDLDNTIKSAMEYTLNPEASEIPVRIKDPKKSIQELEFVDGKGEVQHVSQHNLHEDIDALSTWGEAPGNDWTLRVKMRTAKNVVRQSFVLTDVALP